MNAGIDGTEAHVLHALNDELARPADDILEPDKLDHLVDDLEPLSAVLVAASS